MIKSHIIARPRINKILNRILDYSLYVVCAPMGYGKTTAVKDFISGYKSNVAWLSLYTNRSEEGFWNKFCSEIENIDVDLKASVKCIDYPINELVITDIVECFLTCTFKKSTFIVLDDFHTVKDKNIIHLIKAIARQNIKNLHFVIITRNCDYATFSDVCTLMSSMSADELKFTEDEVGKLAKHLKLEINDRKTNDIIKFSDGWASIIYLLIKDLEKGLIISKKKTVDQIIKSAIYDEYSDDIKELLLNLSFLESFSGEQAEYILEKSGIGKILDGLTISNPFIRYNHDETEYVIHSILRDFLIKEQKKCSIDINPFYIRAGKWFLKSKDYINAFRYYNLGNSIESLLKHKNDKESMHLFTFPSFIFEILKKCSEEQYVKYPYAFLELGCQLVLGNDPAHTQLGGKIIATLQSIALEDPHALGDNSDLILAETYIVNIFICFNDIDKMVESMNKAIPLLDGKSSITITNKSEFTFGAPHFLYCYYSKNGNLDETAKLLAHNFPIFPKISDGCGRGIEYIVMAEYYLETGDMDLAEVNAYKGIYKARTKHQLSLELCAIFVLLRVNLYKGHKEEIANLLLETQRQITEQPSHLYNTTLDLIKGYIYSITEENDKIPNWLKETNDVKHEHRVIGMGFFNVVKAKVLLCIKDYYALDVETDIAPETYSIFNNQLGTIHNMILCAIKDNQLYGIDIAKDTLLEVLNICEVDNIMMPFIENATHIDSLLKIITKESPGNMFYKKIYRRCKAYIKNLQLLVGDVNLTSKEKQVINLLSKGYSRNDIGDKLYISLNTVKKHINSIYKKFEVNNKLSAIEKAKKLGYIIDSL